MEIQMTEQVAKIFEETEKMTLNEKQSLFWIMVERWGQENVLSYKIENDENGIHYILNKKKIANEPEKRRIGYFPKGSFVMSDDFNEPLEDFNEYMH